MAFIGYPEYPYFPYAAAAAYPGPYPYRSPFVDTFVSPYAYPGLYDNCCRGCSPRRRCCPERQCCHEKRGPEKKTKIKIIVQCAKCEKSPCTCGQQQVKRGKKNNQMIVQA
jgi:hypothetical protein